MNSSAKFLSDVPFSKLQAREKLNLETIRSSFQSHLIDRANSSLTRRLEATRLHKSDPYFHC